MEISFADHIVLQSYTVAQTVVEISLVKYFTVSCGARLITFTSVRLFTSYIWLGNYSTERIRCLPFLENNCDIIKFILLRTTK